MTRAARGGKARLSMGGREQTTVPDELGARGEPVAHGAPGELADVQRHNAFVPKALVLHAVFYLIVLVTEGTFIRNGGVPVRQGAWPRGRWELSRAVGLDQTDLYPCAQQGRPRSGVAP
jgi:hypothetical protein